MSRKTSAQRVASNVRAEMARKHITQDDLAKHFGRSHDFIQRRLAGKPPFNIAELDTIASVLEVEVSYLVGDDQTIAS